MIDAGHYGVEQIFIRQMAEYLSGSFPQIKVEAVESGEPFVVL